MKAAKAHLSLYENKYIGHLIAELRRAKRASGEPWVRKFDYDVAYTRTLFAGEGRKSGVNPSGGGVCYKSHDAYVQPAFFSAGNRPRNGAAVDAFKNMFTSTTSLLKDFVTVVLNF